MFIHQGPFTLVFFFLSSPLAFTLVLHNAVYVFMNKVVFLKSKIIYVFKICVKVDALTRVINES